MKPMGIRWHTWEEFSLKIIILQRRYGLLVDFKRSNSNINSKSETRFSSGRNKKRIHSETQGVNQTMNFGRMPIERIYYHKKIIWQRTSIFYETLHRRICTTAFIKLTSYLC